LMDAGMSSAKPLAGIAMGMVQEGDKIIFLSDISGLEDGIGDMDFKVAGTDKGITALQMDTNGTPLSLDWMKVALDQATKGMLHILSVMSAQTISVPKKQKSPYAPILQTVKIPVDKIRDVIGSGGKVIRELCESTNSKIDIEDNGTVHVFSPTSELCQKAVERIKQLTNMPVVGEIYQGVVVKLADFGAFVSFGFAQDGMVHISEVTRERLEDITTVLSVGDKVTVKLIGLDVRGRIKLSIKQAMNG
jgi:polyribonucleotide nucleotidyltransferase